MSNKILYILTLHAISRRLQEGRSTHRLHIKCVCSYNFGDFIDFEDFLAVDKLY